MFDDGGDGGDSAEDGEYWDHGCSPLLICPGVSRTYSYKQNPCQKEKCDFQAKIAGRRIRAICVDGYIYKIVYGNTFSYAIQNTKGPAEAEPELFSKNADGCWVDCLARVARSQ